MSRIARPATAVLAALVLALAGCGADTPIADATGSPGPEPSTSPSSPASIPATQTPDRSGSATALSPAEQASLNQDLREATWANDLDEATTPSIAVLIAASVVSPAAPEGCGDPRGGQWAEAGVTRGGPRRR